MNSELINNLNKGLFLEESRELIPWKTHFDELSDIGNPEVLNMSDDRVDLIWRNEKILNGISTDVTIMRWFGVFGINKKFKYAYAHLSPDDFEKAKSYLSSELMMPGKRKSLSEVDYTLTWYLEHCKIVLEQQDRFGLSWIIHLKFRALW